MTSKTSSASASAKPVKTPSASAGTEPAKTSTSVKTGTKPVKALYRKYRPTSLDDVVGQDQITTPLKSAIKQGKISHAYLFIGPRGTGKTSVARIFAHAINNFDYQLEDNYLDIIEIDAASNTGVDNIRELREKAIIAPTKGKYKVYIIDEVHMLTKSAANALLKTLEEPPEHVVFIMATTDAYKVPITISSRTQVHTFRLADHETMKSHLRKIADAENIPIEDSALDIVVRRGGGSFRDSLSILDQITTLSDQVITAELLERALGLPETQALSELLTAYAANDATTIHTLLKNLLNTGIKPETIASELIETIIQHPEPSLLPLLAKLPEVQPPFSNAKLLLALLQNPTGSTAQNPTGSTAQNPTGNTSQRSINGIPQSFPNNISQNPLATPTKNPTAPIAPEPAPKTTPPSNPTLAKTPSKPAENAPESKIASEDPQNPAPTPTKTPQKPANDQPFDWKDFLETIRQDHNAIFLQLQKTDHEFDGRTLQIYPSNKFSERVLKKDSNRRIIAEALPDGIELIVHSIDERTAPKDATISQISAIMGNVKEIDTDMPF